ncbi:MAG TPA: hypothetical protein VEQ85_10660, partial [Lacipirellulaceae bacterium]|nr:hypothetical protein [Lacipirellulaceae bacterium]
FKVRDKLEINTGAGRDAVRIDGLTNFGDVWIRTGAADDLVTMKNANAGVNKDSLLWFDLGAGNDTLELGSAPNALGVVHGFNLRVDARDGNDRVEMRDAFFDFGVAVQLGIGDDVLNMANVQARTNMSVRGEAGNDTVNLTQVEAAENFFAFMGEGSDTLNVVNLKTQKAELNGGDGDGFDRLFFGQSPQVGSLIRSAFEEVNGQKLLKKVAVAGQPSAR